MSETNPIRWELADAVRNGVLTDEQRRMMAQFVSIFGALADGAQADGTVASAEQSAANWDSMLQPWVHVLDATAETHDPDMSATERLQLLRNQSAMHQHHQRRIDQEIKQLEAEARQ